MRKMWTGTAAAAALATAFAIPVAFAQETQQGKQAPASMENGEHHQTGQTRERKGEHAAQAQTDQSRMSGEKAQGPTAGEQAGKPGMKGESAQMQEPTNRAQPGKSEGERGKTAQTQERKTEPGKAAQTQERKMEPGKAAQTQERKMEPGKAAQTQERKTEPGKAAQTQERRTEPGKAAQTDMQNRQGAAQTGQSGKPMTAQNVQTMGKTNLPHDKAAKVAQTLMASGGAQTTTNINISEVNVGASLPTDVVINPLPMTIVELVPEFRGYDYIVMHDEIVIIDPATRRVVEIIEEVG